MPWYDYECQKCGHLWESEQGIRDAPEKTCPQCGEEAAKRLIGRTSFTLNGGGWARDGYK